MGEHLGCVLVKATSHAPSIGDDRSFIEAAATPLAAGTADEVLSRLQLSPGSRLLVLGGSGGVGLFLLQLAAEQGIDAIGVGRRAMHDQMQNLGAAACIDYTTEDIASRTAELAGGSVDAIADLVGGTTLAGALTALRRNGSAPQLQPESAHSRIA